MIFIRLSLFSKNLFAAINQGPVYLKAFAPKIMYKLRTAKIKFTEKSIGKKSKPTSLQAVLNLTIDHPTFILMGSFVKKFSPRNAKFFLPASDFASGSG